MRQTETSAGQRSAARTKLLCGAHVAPGSATGDTPGCSTTSPPKKTALLKTRPNAGRAHQSGGPALERRNQRSQHHRGPPELILQAAARQQARRPPEQTRRHPRRRERPDPRRRSEPAGRRRRIRVISRLTVRHRLVNRLPNPPNRHLRQGGGPGNKRPRTCPIRPRLEPEPPVVPVFRPLPRPAIPALMDQRNRTPHRRARRPRSASRNRHRCSRSR